MIYSFKESKSKELKRGFQFKIDLFANSSVYDLHRQMNISLELNKLYLKNWSESRQKQTIALINSQTYFKIQKAKSCVFII